MDTKAHTSDAEAEQAGTKEGDREIVLLKPGTLRRSFKVLIYGLKLWGFVAKFWEWFS